MTMITNNLLIVVFMDVQRCVKTDDNSNKYRRRYVISLISMLTCAFPSVQIVTRPFCIKYMNKMINFIHEGLAFISFTAACL